MICCENVVDIALLYLLSEIVSSLLFTYLRLWEQKIFTIIDSKKLL